VGLRRLRSDIRRTVGGVLAFLQHLLRGHIVEIGLGQLSAESTVAVRGRPNRYLVTISNARTEPRDLTLAIDIHAVDPPAHPAARYAHFSKRLTARPLASTAIEVQYDWLTDAGFVVGDVLFPADDLWTGALERSTRYSVNALLLDSSGAPLELLTVYQELAP
jgi:hypothetical protein